MIAIGLNIMKNFEVLLKEKGYKLTEQRQIIWNIMMESLGRHLSTKDIWEIARKKDHTLGIATVYRTLQIMDELGMVTSFDKRDELNKYELNTEGKSSVHPHLICIRCEKIIDVEENLLISEPIVKIHNKYNFELKDIRVKCYGICEECEGKSIK